MGRTIILITGMILVLLVTRGTAASWDEQTWDDVSHADVVIMPLEFLEKEIVLCAEGQSESCAYLAEMFDAANPEWYVVDAIPIGWSPDAINKDWTRKPADEIRVMRASTYRPAVVEAYLAVIRKLERDGAGGKSAQTAPYDHLRRVTARSFDDAQDVEEWVDATRKGLDERNDGGPVRASHIRLPSNQYSHVSR